MGHDLDVGREAELIDGDDAGDTITAIDQDAEIARQSARMAGHSDELSAASSAS
jgi:hypothetical protein